MLVCQFRHFRKPSPFLSWRLVYNSKVCAFRQQQFSNFFTKILDQLFRDHFQLQKRIFHFALLAKNTIKQPTPQILQTLINPPVPTGDLKKIIDAQGLAVPKGIYSVIYVRRKIIAISHSRRFEATNQFRLINSRQSMTLNSHTLAADHQITITSPSTLFKFTSLLNTTKCKSAYKVLLQERINADNRKHCDNRSCRTH